MTDHDAPDRAVPATKDTGGRGCLIALEVLGWIFAAAVTVVAVAVIGISNHFECGGTLGGFGESATANLDEACMGRRQWLLLVPPVLLGAIVAIRGLVYRRTSHRDRQRSGAVWTRRLSGRRGARGGGR